MHRYAVVSDTDRKIFNRTARSVKAVNIYPNHMRGGIRL